jgi:hypothetical protein
MRPDWNEVERRSRRSQERPQQLFAISALVALGVLAWTHFAGSTSKTMPQSPVDEAYVSEAPVPSNAGPAPASIERSSPSSQDARRESYVGVYECVVGGQRVVSDQPCGADAQARTLIVDQPDPREAARLRQQQWRAQQQSARSKATSTASGGAPAVAAEPANAGACDAVDQAIEALNARMRQAYSSSEGEDLRERWHALKERRYSLKCGR